MFQKKRFVRLTAQRLPTPLAAHGADQDVRYFGARELHWRALAVRQHLAHLGAGKRDVVLLRMRAGLRRRHALAALAPELMLVAERRRADPPGAGRAEDVS